MKMLLSLGFTGPSAKVRACGVAAWICFGSAVTPLAASAAASAPASAASAAASVQARYEQERARCLNGSSNQDRATCLKEAGAARDEARKSRLDDKGADYKSDAMARCAALTGDEARDCKTRVMGVGTTTGSVQSGGVFRETTSRETRPTGAASAASAAR